MYFGQLRSMLHESVPNQASFDAILRHLLNASWHEDPRLREECLAYAQAGLARWPDVERCLFVDADEVRFLDHVLDWAPLARGLSLRDADTFLPIAHEGFALGVFAGVRHLALDRTAGDLDAARMLGDGLAGLRGLNLARRPDERVLDALLTDPGALRWLVAPSWYPGERVGVLARCQGLTYFHGLLRPEDLTWFGQHTFPALRTLHLGSVGQWAREPIIELADFDALTIVGLDRRNRERWRDPILARGWQLGTTDDIIRCVGRMSD